MTEKEWMETNDFEAIETYIWQARPTVKPTASKRKVQLFCCACCRRIWHLMHDIRIRNAVEITEQLADAKVHEQVLTNAADEAERLNEPGSDDATDAAVCTCSVCDDYDSNLGAISNVAFKTRDALRLEALAANRNDGAALDAESSMQCQILRDIFGNPFRPVALDPRWLTSTVIDLARTIYEERVWERMPILADALMDAGCDSEEILNHCRGPGPHVRGCWVVDLLLQKE